jgi:cytoskeleton protein RodZ
VSRPGRRRSRSHGRQRAQAASQMRPSPSSAVDPPEILEAAGGATTVDASAQCLDDSPASTARGEGRAHGAERPAGYVLQQRREALGLTLEDLARTTKINRHTLHAIETNDVLLLPAAIYTRGFVKAYAREVGLDPETTARAFMRSIEALTGLVPAATPETAPPPVEVAPLTMALASDESTLAHPRRVWMGRAAVAVAAAGFVVYLALRDDGSVAVNEVREAADVSRTGGPIDDPRAAVDPAVASAADAPLRIEMSTRGPCWISVRIGEETVFAKLLQAGDRETFELTDGAIVRVGEPSALTFSINGQTGRVLGPAGQPVTLHITRDNFREFLSS